jgi:purine-binding chemotaxis protein CheW
MNEPDNLDWMLAYQRIAAADRALDEADNPSAARLQAAWEARARALAAPLAAGDDERAARLPVAVFLLAGERYAVDVTRVLAIQPLEDLTPVPHTPPHIAGVAIVRGRVLAVLDLRALFDLPRQGLTENSRVLVVQGAGIEAGLLADEVLAVENLRPDALEAPLAHLAGARAEYLRGITADMTAVLDVDALLGDRRLVVHDEAG